MKKHISMMLIVMLAISGLAIYTTQSRADCDDYSDILQKACITYCETLDCDCDDCSFTIPHQKICSNIEKQFVKKTGSGPSCEVDPCHELVMVAECLCDYSLVPKDSMCWSDCTGCSGEPVPFIPCESPGCLSPNDNCKLLASHTEISRGINAGKALDEGGFCGVSVADLAPCPAEDQLHLKLSDDQLATCLCRLAQYANELHPIVSVTDSGPPFSCEPPDA